MTDDLRARYQDVVKLEADLLQRINLRRVALHRRKTAQEDMEADVLPMVLERQEARRERDRLEPLVMQRYSAP
jgi:hypothetical protein